MEYRILGPLEVLAGDRSLPLGGPKQRALLALLLLRANEVVAADELIDRLWQGGGPATAAKVLQVQVWRLRKVLGSDVLATRAPGYALRIGADELDLARFETLVREARGAPPAVAAEKLSAALALWRGTPLGDLAHEDFALEVARLDELRLVALEERIEADLALGREAEVVPELEALVAANPYRERLHGQLMLALYRSGRQADALERYQALRRLLDEELGLEPGELVKDLQKAILGHDPSLASPDRPGPIAQVKAVLVALDGPGGELERLLALAAPLVQSDPARELVIARVVAADELSEATSALSARTAELATERIAARAAAFASSSPGADIARLASRHEADLVVARLPSDSLDDETLRLLEKAPCDVALLVAGGGQPAAGAVLVPFGAGEHDWSALELGTWIARATDRPLRVVGAAPDTAADGQDASRLLADASLIVQRTAGIAAEPLLARRGRETLATLADGAGLLVVGLSERWRAEGLGRVRSELAASPPAPTVFVRRGVRPGGLAPAESRTRFTWSLTHAGTAA
ncbi:MAG TPA: AfsR/SARP family transcriptional regulator [Gaiellaceae bacterium]|nr:AfsR/SARP family transcriptional regulator [Gaiellaceae bacterium]